MTNRKSKLEEFLEGEDFRERASDANLESANNFVDCYQELIERSREEAIPDFDPFQKVKKHKISAVRKISKVVAGVAAVFFLLLLVGSLFFGKQQPKSLKLAMNETQLEEVQQKSLHALKTFSEKLNDELGQLNQMEELQKPFRSMPKIDQSLIQNLKNN